MRISDWSSDVCSSDLIGQTALWASSAALAPRHIGRRACVAAPRQGGAPRARISAQGPRRPDQRLMRLPILPTLVVAAAVAVMIGLGFWQLERKEWKEALIAEAHGSLRPKAYDCAIDAAPEVRAGRSRAGGRGYR